MLEREFKSWFGELHDVTTEANDIRKNLAIKLMSAQLSVELVYTILYTITEHTVGRSKSDDWKIYQNYDFINKNEFLIESMVVPENI